MFMLKYKVFFANTARNRSATLVKRILHPKENSMIRQKVAAEEAVEENGLKDYPNSKACNQRKQPMAAATQVKVKSRVVKGRGIVAQVSSTTFSGGRRQVRSRRPARRG